ncbi:hypothetical protein Tco_0474321 [Tanacetum coccineum]
MPATTPTIDPPVIHDDTSLIPTETPTISPITSMIPPTAPTTHYTSPFIHTDLSDEDTPDTPPSPTHEIPPVEVAPPTGQILPVPFGVHCRRVTIVSPGQPIPYGRPYRYHPNGSVYMMTVRKRVGPLLTHCLAVRHSVNYSSSDHFTSDDSSRDSPSGSSSETSLDSSLNALSDSSLGHSSSDHSSPALPSGMRSSHQLCSLVPSIPHSSVAITERPSHYSSAGPSRKRTRSPTTYVPVYSHIPGVLSFVRADLLPPRKKIRSSDYVADLKVSSDESSESSVPRKTGLRVDVDIGGSDEPYSEPDIDPKEEGAIEATYEMLGDLVQRFHDHTVEIPVHRVQVIESTQRDQGHRIVATGQQSAIFPERISELKQDNTRLRGTTMPNTRSGVTMTYEAVNELITRRVAEALEARDVTKNLEPLAEGRDEQGDENGDDYEGGNGGGNGNGNGGVNGNGNDNGNGVNENGNGGGNGNGNDDGNGGGNGYGNHNVNFRCFMPVARECTFQDFLKCQPLNFNGKEGVVGLTR